jgi:hypothetical protein
MEMDRRRSTKGNSPKRDVPKSKVASSDIYSRVN